MLETAMLKVSSTEAVSDGAVVNECFRSYGGAAYVTDRPFETHAARRANQSIGERRERSALTSFIAVGLRGPGRQFQEIAGAMRHPWGVAPSLVVGMERVGAAVRAPDVPVRSPAIGPYDYRLGQLIAI